jgi:hypothetical protein
MIQLKSRAEIEIMRKASLIVAEILEEVRRQVRRRDHRGAGSYRRGSTRARLPAFKGYEVGRVYPRDLYFRQRGSRTRTRQPALEAGDIVG